MQDVHSSSPRRARSFLAESRTAAKVAPAPTRAEWTPEHARIAWRRAVAPIAAPIVAESARTCAHVLAQAAGALHATAARFYKARRARRARLARREASVRARHAGTQVAKSRASWLAPGCGPELSEIPP